MWTHAGREPVGRPAVSGPCGYAGRALLSSPPPHCKHLTLPPSLPPCLQRRQDHSSQAQGGSALRQVPPCLALLTPRTSKALLASFTDAEYFQRQKTAPVEFKGGFRGSPLFSTPVAQDTGRHALGPRLRKDIQGLPPRQSQHRRGHAPAPCPGSSASTFAQSRPPGECSH